MSELEPTRTCSNPTATDVLRRMLDERGVEWHDTKIGKGFITVYEHDCITWIVTEHSSGRLSVKGCVKPTQGHYDGMTPEQAIAATLGRGTCQQEEHGWSTEGDHARVWLTCGHDCMVETVADLPNYCPICGAEVMHV